MADTVPYHGRDGFIWYDSALVPWRQANLLFTGQDLITDYGAAVQPRRLAAE
jgi:hypothetical protein